MLRTSRFSRIVAAVLIAVTAVIGSFVLAPTAHAQVLLISTSPNPAVLGDPLAVRFLCAFRPEGQRLLFVRASVRSPNGDAVVTAFGAEFAPEAYEVVLQLPEDATAGVWSLTITCTYANSVDTGTGTISVVEPTPTTTTTTTTEPPTTTTEPPTTTTEPPTTTTEPPPTTAPACTPRAKDDRYNTRPGRTVTGGVTQNDRSCGLPVNLVQGPSSGTLALSSDGSFSYTPAAGFTGTDTFGYSLGSGASSAVVSIRVNGRP